MSLGLVGSDEQCQQILKHLQHHINVHLGARNSSVVVIILDGPRFLDYDNTHAFVQRHVDDAYIKNSCLPGIIVVIDNAHSILLSERDYFNSIAKMYRTIFVSSSSGAGLQELTKVSQQFVHFTYSTPTESSCFQKRSCNCVLL